MTDAIATPMPTAAPAAPIAATQDTSKIAAQPDKAQADSVKADTPAEKEVIRKIKLGETEYDETTLKEMIEKSKGADKKFLEAARARKEAIRFFKMAKENPREFLSKTGLDPKKFAYDEVAKDIQDKLRDPREVELEAAKKRLEEFEKKDADAREKTRQEKQDQEAKAMEARFHKEIIEALESTPALPKNGFTVARIAKYIDTVRDKTGVLLSAKEVASVVEKDILQEIRGVVNGASAEKLISLIGEDGITAIRKYDLARLKNPLANGTGATGTGEQTEKPKRWKNSHDFWKTIGKGA